MSTTGTRPGDVREEEEEGVYGGEKEGNVDIGPLQINEEDISIDLNDHFEYTMDSLLDEQRLLILPPLPHHSSSTSPRKDQIFSVNSSFVSSSGITPSSQHASSELNGFEKLLQTNHNFNDMTQTQEKMNQNLEQRKNYYEEIQDHHEEFLTTQVDNRYKTLKSIYELTPEDFIQCDDQKSLDTSLQACLAMIFGYSNADLAQHGGFFPPFSTRNSNFEVDLNDWITSHTNCAYHLIPYDQIPTLDVSGGVLCVVYGMIKNSVKHCFVGYVDLSSRRLSSDHIRCLLDPCDSDCVDGPDCIEDNFIKLAEIDWILYFDTTFSLVRSPQLNHTEVLSLEQFGLFTQDERVSDHSAESDQHDSYMKLAQSTVELDHSNSVGAPIFDNLLHEPNSALDATEEPTEIVPTQEMSAYAITTKPAPIMKPISLAFSPTPQDDNSEPELEPTEIVGTPPLSPAPNNESIKKPLLGFSPTQQLVEENISCQSPQKEHCSQLIDDTKTHNKIHLGFTQSQPPVIEKINPLLGFTQTQHVEPEKGEDKDGNFIFLSHLTGESQYTLSTYPSQSQPVLHTNSLSAQTPHSIIDISETPPQSVTLKVHPSLETVPSIHSHRIMIGTSSATCALESPVGQDMKEPSDGWISSRKAPSEAVSRLEEVEEETQSHGIPDQSNDSTLQEMSELMKRLQEKERELQERENELKKKEFEITLRTKALEREHSPISAPPAIPISPTSNKEPISQTNLSSMTKADSLSQGGVLAVDGLLQLKHSETKQPQMETRFQWSSLQKLPEGVFESNEETPKTATRLIRKKVAPANESPQKPTILKSTFEFEPNSSPPELETSITKKSNQSSQGAVSQGSKKSKVESSQEYEWDTQVDLIMRANKVTPRESQVSIAEENFPNDIPLSLRYRNDIDSMKWTEIWNELQHAGGWFWQRGRGLVDFAYCRPGKNYQLSVGTEGVDYFTSQSALIEFVRENAIDRPSQQPTSQSIVETIIPFSQSDHEKGEKMNSKKRKLSDSTVKAPNTFAPNDWKKDLSSLSWPELWRKLQAEGWTWDYGSELVTTWYLLPGVRKSSGIAGKTMFGSEEDVRQYLTNEMCSHLQVLKEDVSDNDDEVKTLPVPSINFDWRKEISSLSWPDLWRNLQAEGWTWDHGSGLVTTWYLLPGIQKSSGIAGKNMFGSKEDVRKYVMKRNASISNQEEEDVSTRIVVNWRDEIKTLPWPELWRNLQAEGWTWDHGSGLIERWYLRPGISKFSKGIVGVSVFGSQEDVRNYLLRNNGANSNKGGDVSDSDDWELVKNRRKRNMNSRYQDHRTNLNNYYETNHLRKNNKRTENNQSCKKLKRSRSEHEESTQQQDIYQADFSESESGERESERESRRVPYVGNMSRRRPLLLQERPQSTSLETTPPHAHRSDITRIRTEATPDYLLKTLPKILSPKLTSPFSMSATSTSPLSSSSTGARHPHKKKSGDSDKIFSKMKLFFTGISAPYDREDLEKKVEKCGGGVLNDKTLQRAITEGHALDSTLVIACPSGFRRPNYLFAIAAGLVLVHPKWILDSLASPNNSVLPVDQYVLPSGSSVLHPYFIFRKMTPDGGVFTQLRIVCINIPIWHGIVGTAGGIVCPDTDDNISKYRSYLLSVLSSSKLKQITVPLPDYVIVDSFMYAEGNLNPLVSDFIEQCMALVNSPEYTGHLIPKIVTTEWAAYCLGIGEIVDPSLHGVFTLPSDRIRNSRVFKMPGDGGGGRYVVGDTVFFNISKVINDSHRLDEPGNISVRCHQQYLKQKGYNNTVLIGKIMSFVRRSAIDAVQVKIRPLRVRCLQCEGVAPRGSLAASVEKDCHHTYELHMDNIEGDIILSTSMLLKNYPTVLSSSSYQRLAYSQSDSTVYMSSPEWEGAMNYVTDSEYSQDDSVTRPVYLQQSQDY